MEENQERVLILDAHSPAALAIVRSLGSRRLGVDVAGEAGQFNLVYFSKFPRCRFIYPSPAKSLNDFLGFFEELLSRNVYQFIFPVTDRTILPLHRFRERFEHFERIALPDFDPLEATLDKEKTLHLAARLGVPVPKTILFGPGDKWREQLGRLNYPLVVKARYSKYLKGGRLISDEGPQFVNSEEELLAVCRNKNREIPAPLIQEMIRGDGYGIFVLAQGGKPRVVFAHHRLREEHPLGARSSYCESVSPPPLMKEYALRLLGELKWSGVAMVEYKLDRRDGVPKLMEINGRFWGSLPLAVAAGVDFPFLYFQQLCGKSVSPDQKYDISCRARFLYADIQYLLNVFKGAPAEWMSFYPTKTEAVMSFLSAFRPGIKYYNLTHGDLAPGLVENARFLLSTFPRRMLTSP